MVLNGSLAAFTAAGVEGGKGFGTMIESGGDERESRRGRRS